ncbi:MAG: cardiolipin synthase [Thermodesulfobacteriota bacterium]
MNIFLDIGIIIIVLDLYAVFRAISRGHGVEGTLAWILAIFAFPGFGALSYLLFANPGIKSTTRRKRLTAETVRKAIMTRIGITAAGEPGSVLHLSSSLTGLLPTVGNSVDLLTENEQAFEQIEQVIEEAKHSIWAEYYLISNDETGHHFLELLAAQAGKGIEVRLLYDAVGSLRIDAERLSAIKTAGGKAESFLPVNPLKKRWSVHLRNHRKIIIVDGQTGFTGGMNVGNEYSGQKWRKKPAARFRDTHLALRGPAVSDLARIFSEDWTFATGEPLACPEPPVLSEHGTSVVSVVPSGPDQKYNASRLVYFTAITSARKHCYLSTPYFIPDEPTMQALISAAARGVDVRILVPEKSDVAIAGPATRSYYPRLVHAGVRIFEYRASMLHAKSLAVDGAWSVVGSANADIRSFRLNFELGVIVTDPMFTQRLEERFSQDFSLSREIRAGHLYQQGLAERLWQGTCRLLSPLL